MTPIDRYLEAAGKATEGPWKHDGADGCKAIKGGKCGSHRQAQHKNVGFTDGLNDDAEDMANADLICAARNASADIEKLVKLNKALLDTTDATAIAVIKGEIRELVG